MIPVSAYSNALIPWVIDMLATGYHLLASKVKQVGWSGLTYNKRQTKLLQNTYIRSEILNTVVVMATLFLYNMVKGLKNGSILSHK